MLKTVPKLDITTEIITITPDIAEAWLTKNENNRSMASERVAAYARDMKAGRWHLNGDAIRFSRDSILLDGQQRLMACIKADCNFQSVVIYNLDPESQDTMDSGRPRRACDVLHMKGHTSGSLRVAALRLIIGIKLNLDAPYSFAATTQEILAAHNKHSSLAKSLHVQKYSVQVRGTMLLTIHYIGTNFTGDQLSAVEFANVFATGRPFYKDDPALLLRERAIQAKLRGQPLNQATSWHLMLMAWNKFRKREPLKVMNKKIDSSIRFDDLDIRKL